MANKRTDVSALWEFWIDVGGTFTDCIGRDPKGRLHRHKTLSSGVVKGTVGAGSTRQRIQDNARKRDPSDFWTGWTLHLIDANGRPTESRAVARFLSAPGQFELREPLGSDPRAGHTYELVSSLEAPLIGIRYILELPLKQKLPRVLMRLGTTRGTNALLTRSGAKTALITTAGFGDTLAIGHQARPKLFDLNVRKTQPLYCSVAEVVERLDRDGAVLVEARDEQIRAELRRLQGEGIEALAICLLNSYASAEHERQVERVARELGFEEISVSSRVAPLIKLVPRGETTVVNAYLNVVLRRYLRRLSAEMASSRANDLRMMTSSGGLVSADQFHGKDSILSGPAGGVVGFARVAEASGFPRAIGFDMGGTSTDVARYDGVFERQFEAEKAGVRIVAPMLMIETVAAGGGSICGFDGVKLTVGPDSAGADPGPACYGRGGPLTVTDVNLILGKVLPDQFPFALNAEAVKARLRELRREIHARVDRSFTDVGLADGFLQIANANMAQAIRTISVAKGYDPRDYVMVSFGGAAPQHACAVARELGIRQILNHPDASILSALGVGHADVTRHAVRGIYEILTDLVSSDLAKHFDELQHQAVTGLSAEHIPPERIHLTRSLELRYDGTDSTLTVVEPADGNFRQAFSRMHQQRYGYTHPDRPVEIVAVRVEAIGKSSISLPTSKRITPTTAATPQAHGDVVFDAQAMRTSHYRRDQLLPGDRLSGPALIIEDMSTTVVDPGWEVEVGEHGELLIRDHCSAMTSSISAEYDPITLEIFHRHFESIAEQMGVTLCNTSSSVNVKERLDFSCAVFTRNGKLVVNAPHIPVHLGAMGETVRSVLDDHPDLKEGDVVITNDPYRGGSHLPDITIITPVYDDGRLRFLVASRAHHAEIGGVTPGSMPPFSTCLAEEGVYLRSFKLIDEGQSRLEQLRARLLSAPYPTRDVASNLADVTAQIAANQQGVHHLQELIARYGWTVVESYMTHIQSAAEAKMRSALVQLPDGEYRWEDFLDNQAPIQVAVSIRNDHARIDFSGSAAVSADNLNANRAIVTAATMYCLRCMIDQDIPLNEGVLDPVELIVPEGLLNPPAGHSAETSPAVAGGNVETSQRVVDVLLGALQLAAASQGTMNNLLFGNDSFGYYETICGGAGATPSAAGADAVHTHMTNTRLTDPEVIERNYPIRIVEFRIRRDSGGEGKYRGGNGVVRQLEFLEPLQLSIVSQRRGPYAPYGMRGGQPGKLGRNRLIRKGGEVLELAWRVQTNVHPGDRLIVETPGGGGYGDPD